MIHNRLTVLILFFTVFEINTAFSDSWTATPGYPHAFIENKGQFDGRNKIPASKILYAIDHGPFQVYFTKSGLTYRIDQKVRRQNKPEREEEEELREIKEKSEKKLRFKMLSELIHLEWVGSNPDVQIVSDGLKSDYFNYSMGSNDEHYDFAKSYDRIVYNELYPGIDLEYFFHPDSGFKYTFHLSPGADPSVIRLRYNGDVRPRMDVSGNIRFKTRLGDIVDYAPYSFIADAGKSNVKSSFVLKNSVQTFQLADYPKASKLVIDPWVVFPVSPNSNKVWETETDAGGNVYTYAGDMPFTLRKYDIAGNLLWTYLTSWDSSGFWVGGMITHPSGDTYMTSGSNGEIRKINSAGVQQWYNNPNSLTSYEYWSPAFNCDLSELVVGGSRATFSIPTPLIRGAIMRINLSNGSIISTTVVGYGNVIGFPPDVQEVSSLCSAPNGNYYFLTLDSTGAIDDNLSAIQFKAPTAYNFDYYIPGYGFGTKQPISAIRADATAYYTQNGVTVDKRDLNTGAILATASIPGGITTGSFFGTNVQGNGGLDIDSCGNVYVGSGNGVYKFNSNLILLSSATTPGPVYDVDVNRNGDIAFCGQGFSGAASLQACGVPQAICSTGLSISISVTGISCTGQCNGSGNASPLGGNGPYSYLWSNGATTANISGLCPGLYAVTVTDANGLSATNSVAVTQPLPLTSNVSVIPSTCGLPNGSITATTSGGTAPFAFLWSNGVLNQINSGIPAGVYTVLITDANGCTVSDTAIITSTAPLLISTQATQPSCNQSNGSILSVAVGGTPGYTFMWSNGTTGNQLNGVPAGTYVLTVSDAAGCSVQDTIILQSSNGFTINAVTTPGCGSSTAGVTPVGGTAPYTYSWQPSGGNGAQAVALSAGNYVCVVGDANGCTDSVVISVVVYPDPNASAGADQTIDQGDTVQLTANGGIAYNWTPSNGLSCNNCPNPLVSPTSTTTYCVTAADSNGCTDSDCITITVNDIECGEIFIPNVFAPDQAADPENKKLCVYGRCIASMEFSIFSRWGEKVFESGDQQICWDGTWKGKTMNGGVFAYTLKAKLINGDVITKKGEVRLIR